MSDVVREMHAGDLEAVARCHQAAWSVAFRGILGDDLLDGLRREEFIAGWERNLRQPDRTNLVALGPRGPFGFVAFGPSRDEDADRRLDGEGDGELYGLYVDPDAWGRGAGRALDTAAGERLAAAGYREARVWTMANNSAARGFYERVGYACDGGCRLTTRKGESFEEVRLRRPLIGQALG